MSTLSASQLIKEVRPEVMTATSSAEKASRNAPADPITGFLIGSSIGSLLWMAILSAVVILL